MPLSIWNGLEDALAAIVEVRPRAVLDVGIGFGLWGHLLRQYLDVWAGRVARASWAVRIDGVELERRRVLPPSRYLYDRVHVGDLRALVPRLTATTTYDVVLFGDVLEHLPAADAHRALACAVARAARRVVVRIPLGDTWRRRGREPADHHRSRWTVDDFARYRATVKVHDFHGNPYGLVVIPSAPARAAGDAMLALDERLGALEARLAALATEAGR